MQIDCVIVRPNDYVVNYCKEVKIVFTRSHCICFVYKKFMFLHYSLIMLKMVYIVFHNDE